MSEINCNPDIVADVAVSLELLADMAGEYTSFTVSSGSSEGYPRQALEDAAAQVSALARAEKELIEKIIAAIVADVADFEGVDEAIARSMLTLSPNG